MGQFKEWIGKKQPQEDYEFGIKPIPKKNAEGGFDPTTTEQVKVFKNADLITLPVIGTNCANCMFVKVTDEKAGIGYCMHKNVQEWVTSKMCCKYWSHPDVKRQWEV